MSYLSLKFLLFLCLALVIYYAAPVKSRRGLLLVYSVGFYLSYDVRYVFFLIFSIGTVFAAALLLKGSANRRKWVLWSCILSNAVIWFLVKDMNWCMLEANKVFRVLKFPVQFPQLKVIVPIGLSYYMLQSISYLVDVYRGKLQPEKNPFKFALFVSYFPAIVQGPISRYEQLAPQFLQGGASVDSDTFADNFLLILFGLVKKMVIADQIAVFANHCFGNYKSLSGIILYLGAVAYAIQLYMDFSGCVDLCRGVSGLFGIELVDNFRMPYFSRSIKEFWQRWHISLSSWLRDYIYIPLGGNRKGKLRKNWNLLITFLVSGIWHGAGFNFIVWGLIHAVYQIAGGSKLKDVSAIVKTRFGISPNSPSEQIYQTVGTFHLVAFAWIFFRAADLKAAIIYIANMFKQFDPWTLFNGSLYQYGIDYRSSVILLLNIAIVFVLEYVQLKKQICVRDNVRTLHIGLRWGIYALLLWDILLFGAYGVGFDASAFLYGGF